MESEAMRQCEPIWIAHWLWGAGVFAPWSHYVEGNGLRRVQDVSFQKHWWNFEVLKLSRFPNTCVRFFLLVLIYNCKIANNYDQFWSYIFMYIHIHISIRTHIHVHMHAIKISLDTCFSQFYTSSLWRMRCYLGLGHCRQPNSLQPKDFWQQRRKVA